MIGKTQESQEGCVCDSVSGVMPLKSRLNPDFTGHAKLQGSLGDPALPQHLRCALSFLGKYHITPSRGCFLSNGSFHQVELKSPGYSGKQLIKI